MVKIEGSKHGGKSRPEHEQKQGEKKKKRHGREELEMVRNKEYKSKGRQINSKKDSRANLSQQYRHKRRRKRDLTLH